MTINDENLLTELKKRNTGALEYIMNTYTNLIYRVVINVLGSENYENVKECINDIYLLVWNKYYLYNPQKSSFKNWILAVSKYKAIDYKRVSGRKNNVQIEEEVLFSSTDIENEYLIKEARNELLKLLSNVDKQDREIFIRKYVFEEDVKAIAKRFSLSRGAVYTRLWRIRNFLIQKFNILYNKEAAK